VEVESHQAIKDLVHVILFIVWYGLTSLIKMSNSASHVLIT